MKNLSGSNKSEPKRFEPIINYDGHIEIEKVYFNESGSITDWYLYSPHCGGLVEQSLEIFKKAWPKHWADMLDKVEERLTEFGLTKYHNAVQAHIQSMFDQSKDDKLEGAS